MGTVSFAPQTDLHVRLPTIRAHLWGVIWPALWFTVGAFSATGPASLPAFSIIVAIGLPLRLALFAWQLVMVRRNGGPPPITITPEHLMLPPHLLSTRTVRLPLHQIQFVAAVGSRLQGRLVISTRWRSFAIPLRCLPDQAALSRFTHALRDAVHAGPGGAGQWAAIEARSARAAAIGQLRPWGSLGAVAMLGLAAGAQMLLVPSGNPVALLYAGANAPALVWHGEWFRVVAANLLHATPRHALADAALLWLTGSALERLAGASRMLLVLLCTAIVAQTAAALTGDLPPSQLFTMGLSGGLLGLLGALAVVIRRFGPSLPIGLRPGIASWLAMTAGIISTSVFTSGVSGVGMFAGGVAGTGLGALLCWGCADIRAFRQRDAAISIAWAISMAVWACALGVGLWQIAAPQSRTTEQATLAASMLAGARIPATQQNDIAWEVAVNPDASPDLLNSATELATRAVATAVRADPKSRQTGAFVDTLASLDFRRGDPVLAMRREIGWIGANPAFDLHFTEFLDRTLREDGIQIFGDIGPAAPTVTLGHGVLQLTVDEAAPAGARVFAVLRNHDRLVGSLMFQIPPHYTGSQILPQPWANGSPSTAAAPAIWSDPATEIRVALFDRRSCFCRVQHMGPSYTEMPAISDLPPWRPAGAKLADVP